MFEALREQLAAAEITMKLRPRYSLIMKTSSRKDPSNVLKRFFNSLNPHNLALVLAYGYIINGNMIGGFAFVEWPASYRQSGIMTLIVNQQGRVYQRELGPDSAKTAEAMKEYDPDKTWSVSAD